MSWLQRGQGRGVRGIVEVPVKVLRKERRCWLGRGVRCDGGRETETGTMEGC